MPRISVCIEMLFREYPFHERIEKVGQLGFPAVEFWFTGQNPSDPSAEEKAYSEIGDTARKAGVAVADFVVNSPDGSITGSLVNPEDREDYLTRLRQVVRLANLCDCKTLITCAGNSVPGRSEAEQVQSIIDTLSVAAPIAQESGITLVLEPLNSLVDHAGYFLDRSSTAADIVRKVNYPNVKLLYDVYHMQVMEGNVIQHIRDYSDIIGHFHGAGVPGRHELTSGELNYREIFREIDALCYQGYFGLEYAPLKPSEQSLLELREALLD